MTQVLINFYNVNLKYNNYAKMHLCIVDAMLEKGKGWWMIELRTIVLIEADLKLLMRFLGLEVNEGCGKDKKMSKHCCASTKKSNWVSAIAKEVNFWMCQKGRRLNGVRNFRFRGAL